VIEVNDYFNPKPAVLIATSRSGSTMLMHCLDSHPQIGCERYEPLNSDGPWMKRTDNNRKAVMRILWERPGYQVAMFKMTYRHIKWIGFDLFYTYNPVIIHLHRDNSLRAILSSMINTAAVKGELDYVSHSYEPLPPPKIEVPLKKLWMELDKYETAVKNMRKQLKETGFPITYLTYEQLTNNQHVFRLPADVESVIYSALRVDDYPMTNQLVKLNSYPLNETIVNWDEVREEFSNTHYAKYLE